VTSLLTAQHPYFVGIKGVAQTALAACLIAAGKVVRGCDVAEEFVTQPQLVRLGITIDDGFSHSLPKNTDCVIFTSAHGAHTNPLVVAAQNTGIFCLSHAQALSELFNATQGIAVCGVGGKSTTSAMLAWISQSLNLNWSYAVGVGEIIGLETTGAWDATSAYFIAEADEYVIDPMAPEKGEEIIPRFSYLHPQITLCTNLQFDHPDVYTNFDHTKQVFLDFFLQIKKNGTLIINADDVNLVTLAQKIVLQRPDITILSYGVAADASLQLKSTQAHLGSTQGLFLFEGKEIALSLPIPGEYNLFNAAGAFLAAHACGIDSAQIAASLAHFHSTQRRIEYRGQFNAADFYDDYAHHPHEITQLLKALRSWYPQHRLVIAFQPHTFSRTKALLADFAESLAAADQVELLKIFSSAREKYDPTVSIEVLAAAVKVHAPEKRITCHQTIHELALSLERQARPNTCIVTVGAGDIYQVYQELNVSK